MSKEQLFRNIIPKLINKDVVDSNDTCSYTDECIDISQEYVLYSINKQNEIKNNIVNVNVNNISIQNINNNNINTNMHDVNSSIEIAKNVTI